MALTSIKVGCGTELALVAMISKGMVWGSQRYLEGFIRIRRQHLAWDESNKSEKSIHAQVASTSWGRFW
jgi:hypothetical protein